MPGGVHNLESTFGALDGCGKWRVIRRETQEVAFLFALGTGEIVGTHPVKTTQRGYKEARLQVTTSSFSRKQMKRTRCPGPNILLALC